MIKAVFFDVDGTLIPFETGILPESAREAIERLRANGIKVFLASGKSILQLRNMSVMQTQYDGYITLNGQLIFDERMNCYAGTPIDEGEMEILSGVFNAKRIPFLLLGESTRYINYVNDLVIQKQLGTNASIPDIGEYQGEKIYQITAFVNSRERKLFENVLDLCKVTAWDENGIDIIAKDGGKLNAIKQVLEILGIDRSETMAFGDEENDLEMIRYCGIGVAMGNGIDEVKNAADYVTADISDDGVKKALMHFNLI